MCTLIIYHHVPYIISNWIMINSSHPISSHTGIIPVGPSLILEGLLVDGRRAPHDEASGPDFQQRRYTYTYTHIIYIYTVHTYIILYIYIYIYIYYTILYVYLSLSMALSAKIHIYIYIYIIMLYSPLVSNKVA